MKYCKNCGTENQDEVVKCVNCGEFLDSEFSSSVQESVENIKIESSSTSNNNTPVDKSYSTITLVLGIIGLGLGLLNMLGEVNIILIIVGLVISIAGVVCGVKARNAIPVGVPGRGKSTAGFVCSIIAIIFNSFFVACVICGSACINIWLYLQYS